MFGLFVMQRRLRSHDGLPRNEREAIRFGQLNLRGSASSLFLATIYPIDWRFAGGTAFLILSRARVCRENTIGGSFFAPPKSNKKSARGTTTTKYDPPSMAEECIQMPSPIRWSGNPRRLPWKKRRPPPDPRINERT